MAGVSNAPFRLVARECGAGRLTSEEIDARGLVADSGHTRELARYLPEEHPIALQLLGSDPEVLADAARRLEDAGADGIDLNMGCPVQKIVAKGHGSALMRDPLAAAVIFRTMRKAIRGPFTIKIRGGWDDRHLNAVEIARLAEDEGVDGDHRAPAHAVPAVHRTGAVGDHRRGRRRRAHSRGGQRRRALSAPMPRPWWRPRGAPGVMIGRGALGAPWIFSPGEVSREARARIIRRHCELMEDHFAPRLAAIQIKKHLAWYTRGLPFSAPARPAIFEAPDAERRQDRFLALLA